MSGCKILITCVEFQQRILLRSTPCGSEHWVVGPQLPTRRIRRRWRSAAWAVPKFQADAHPLQSEAVHQVARGAYYGCDHDR